MTKIYYVRHGESEANENSAIGVRDTLLTQKGMDQARQTGIELKDKGIKNIICSSYLRAQQTAEIIAGELGVPVKNIQVMDILRERGLGNHMGKNRQHEPLWYFLSMEADMEPPEDILKRSHEALDMIKAMNSPGPIAVVGHAISGFYLINAATGITEVKNLPEPELLPNADFEEIEI